MHCGASATPSPPKRPIWVVFGATKQTAAPGTVPVEHGTKLGTFIFLNPAWATTFTSDTFGSDKYFGYFI